MVRTAHPTYLDILAQQADFKTQTAAFESQFLK
jgi:hypothetical protein